MAYNDNRAGSVLSEGASSGLRWGAIGALIGALAVPVAAGAIAASIFSLGFLGAAAVGLVAAVAISPIVAGTALVGGAIGGGLGASSGFTSAGRAANERAIGQAYTMSKAQTFNAMGENLMANMEAAQSQPNPYHQASSKVDAATAQRENARMAETAMENAR